MFLKLVECLCILVSFYCAQSQRLWGSSGTNYNPGFSNSWNSNSGFSINKAPSGNSNNAGSWGNNFGFGERPNGKLIPSQSENSNWGYETASNSDSNRNQKKPGGVNNENSVPWQSESSRKPSEKKFGSIMNLPDSSNWNTNSNDFPTNEENLPFWGSAKPSSSQSSSQNSRPGNWNSNIPNSNAQNENEIPTESDYGDDSIYPSYESANKKKTKPTSNSLGVSGNRESTTSKNNQNYGTSKWEENSNKKPQKTSGFNNWGTNDSSGSGREKPTKNTNSQNEEKPSTLDTSILDDLDKNDWYFGKESNYPKPPFRSTLNIDVSELWNFDKKRKSNQYSQGINNSGGSSVNNNNKKNNKGNKNYNNSNNNNNDNKNNNNSPKSISSNRRRNRQTEGAITIQCECVNVKLCEEEDMIITQEDVKFDFRPLDEFRCEKLTEVCCTNPKMKVSNRAGFNEWKEQLSCGQRRLGEEAFEGLGERIAKPGEFPWSLKLENGEFNCSASLIHHKMALTAAHCVIGALPNELTLKAGIWNSNNEPTQNRKVTKIIPHPDYNSRNPRNDIALLILETPFELTDNVNTICMPVTNDKWDSNQCVVAGWRPEEIQGQVLEVLEKGVVNFLPQPECQNIMLVTDLWRNYILHDSFVCGLEKTGRKSCTGDEGGFVICPSKKRPNTYVQIGIVSKGMNCDQFGRPGIFTNVLKFLDWINNIYFELGLYDDIDIRSLTGLP